MKIILFLLFLGISELAVAGECKFSSSPTLIFEGDHELHQVWVVENDDVFASGGMPNAPGLIQYLSNIKSRIPNLTPQSLLSKQYNDFMSSGAPELMAEAPNMKLASDLTAGKFHPINCLEALLLSQQVDRGLSWNTPMEFSAFILKTAGSDKSFLKIYFSTNDRPGGKVNSQVINLVQSDLANGWILLNHLHNHNFNMPASHGIVLVGGPSPGLSDVSLYRDLYSSMGLKSASVTNGFDTISIDSSEFYIFHAR